MDRNGGQAAYLVQQVSLGVMSDVVGPSDGEVRVDGVYEPGHPPGTAERKTPRMATVMTRPMMG